MHATKTPHHPLPPLFVRQRIGRLLYGGTLLCITILYGLLVILPFYANGIQHVSLDAIEQSAVDVKNYPPFSWPYVGLNLRATAILIGVFTPILALVCGGRLSWAVVASWRQLSSRERIVWMITVGGCMAFLALTLPMFPTIGIWLAD